MGPDPPNHQEITSSARIVLRHSAQKVNCIELNLSAKGGFNYSTLRTEKYI